jgi:hypothetical protein
MQGETMIEVAVSEDGFDCCNKRGLRDRLNLIAAAEAHVAWKIRLGNYIWGEALLDAVFPEQVCPLGNLINGAAFSAFRERDEYRSLSDAHQKFHQLASVVVEKRKADDKAGAAAMFENEYSLALRDILQSLSKINRLLTE